MKMFFAVGYALAWLIIWPISWILMINFLFNVDIAFSIMNCLRIYLISLVVGMAAIVFKLGFEVLFLRLKPNSHD